MSIIPISKEELRKAQADCLQSLHNFQQEFLKEFALMVICVGEILQDYQLGDYDATVKGLSRLISLEYVYRADIETASALALALGLQRELDEFEDFNVLPSQHDDYVQKRVKRLDPTLLSE